MSVYYGHEVQKLQLEEECVYTRIQWHPTFSLLAVASRPAVAADGIVSICHDQGEVIDDLIVQRSVPIEVMKWHPEKKLLACGWQNGGITISNVSTSEVHEHVQGHVSPITTLTWSTRGGHLLTSDKTGLLLVWRLEPGGQLHSTPVHHNQLSSQPTHCVLIGQQSPGRQIQSLHDSISCFIAVKAGILYYMTAKGQCVESEKIKGRFNHLLYSTDNSLLVGITDGLVLMVFVVDTRGILTRTMEAKLSAQGTISSAVWCPEGILATASQEMSIRFWDCLHDENSSLSLKDLYLTEDMTVTDMNYSAANDSLAISTSNGEVAIWKRDPLQSEDGWSHVTTFSVEGVVNNIEWNGSKNLIAMNMSSVVKILSSHQAFAVHSDRLTAVQMSPRDVYLKQHTSNSSFLMKTDIIINGVAITRDHMAVWSDQQVIVYSVSFDKHMVKQTATFSSTSCYAAIHEVNVYTVENDKLIARNTQGVVKHRLPVGGEFDNDRITRLFVSGHFLVLAMNYGAIRIWDLSRREPKLSFEKNLSQTIPQFHKIVHVQSNCATNRLSVVIIRDNNSRSLVIINSSKDITKVLDFSKIVPDDIPQPEMGGVPVVMTIPASVSATIKEEQFSLAHQLNHCNIMRCHWDNVDHRLILIEVEREIKLKRTNSRKHSCQGTEGLLLSAFVTDDMDILLQTTTNVDSKYNCFIGCDAPFLYYLKQKLHMPQSSQGGLDSSTSSETFECPIEQQPLKDFVGLEECDQPTIKAITSFSYYSTIGNMDEAFKSIKTVKSQKVWETLAKMCIKTRRLDVALVCLGNMGNARAAKAVREAQDLPECDARLAVLATQLGMLDEAEELYKNSGRFDLLNQFYQASGRWQKSIEVAEVSDRMNLKTTYFNFAKHSEALGELKPSLRSYERAEAPLEIMRMLNNDGDELEAYVMSSKDHDVRHYWAEYLESVEDLEGAMIEYESCGDIHSQVRVLLLLGDTQRAIEVVEETRDKAAAYYLAQKLSDSQELIDIQRAVQFFTLAHCYSPAIQLAKDNGLDMELMNLALMSTREDKVDVAKFYETNPGSQDKAIMLYHKAGELSKALELCFQYHQYEVLHIIAEELSEGCNPETLKKVAEFFVEQEQFDKAVDLLIRSNRINDALELCSAHHIVINEDLAERMTLEKQENETSEQSQRRLEQLISLGDCLVEQGQWHLAAKKYTQAGNRIKAMKALLKSGDTDKITYFANVSRQKEIYIMSANYLQSLDWRGNPNLMKNIISYYTKGRALESLANFYDTCAQAEIDEYQSYYKAYGALNEAIKCLRKGASKSQGNLEDKIEFFEHRARLIKKFADARNAYASDPDQCIKDCQELLTDPKVDAALRTGDIYGLLITHHCHQQQHKEAYELIEDIKSRIPGVNLEFYVDPNILATVYRTQGFEAAVSADNPEDEEGSDEEVIEEYEAEP